MLYIKMIGKDDSYTMRTVFKIPYRVKSADGKWNQKAETLYGLCGKKAARAA